MEIYFISTLSYFSSWIVLCLSSLNLFYFMIYLTNTGRCKIHVWNTLDYLKGSWCLNFKKTKNILGSLQLFFDVLTYYNREVTAKALLLQNHQWLFLWYVGKFRKNIKFQPTVFYPATNQQNIVLRWEGFLVSYWRYLLLPGNRELSSINVLYS